MEKVVTYFEHEENMVRMERSNRRLWILCIILIVVILATNGGWLWHEMQFEDIVVEQEVDTGEDGTTFVNGVGDLNYGTSETDGKSEAQESGR